MPDSDPYDRWVAADVLLRQEPAEEEDEEEDEGDGKEDDDDGTKATTATRSEHGKSTIAFSKYCNAEMRQYSSLELRRSAMIRIP